MWWGFNDGFKVNLTFRHDHMISVIHCSVALQVTFAEWEKILFNSLKQILVNVPIKSRWGELHDKIFHNSWIKSQKLKLVSHLLWFCQHSEAWHEDHPFPGLALLHQVLQVKNNYLVIFTMLDYISGTNAIYIDVHVTFMQSWPAQGYDRLNKTLYWMLIALLEMLKRTSLWPSGVQWGLTDLLYQISNLSVMIFNIMFFFFF